MSLEALLLGLTTIVRPTSAAAVYAILCSRRPQRLLVAYLAVRLTFSVGIGVAVVLAFQGHDSSIATIARRAVVDIVLGALALGYAAGVWTGRLRGGAAHHHDEESWLQRRMHHLTPAVAALTGIVTHLPGIVYLPRSTPLSEAPTDRRTVCCRSSSTTPCGSASRSWR